MQEEQIKDLQADAALEGLDEELSLEELEVIAAGVKKAFCTTKGAKVMREIFKYLA